MHHNVVFQSGK